MPPGGDPGVGHGSVDSSGPSPQLPLLTMEPGPSALGQGLLQADVLTQLISAVIAGVTPIAKAAFLQQAAGDAGVGASGDGASSSGPSKPKEVVHSLPWGVSCGSALGGVGGSSVGESPMPSGDIAMPLGEHLLQATREEILRGRVCGLFLPFI